MARSLTVKHEENVRTTGLLNGFLLFAAAWMLLSSISWYAETDRADAAAQATAAP